MTVSSLLLGLGSWGARCVLKHACNPLHLGVCYLEDVFPGGMGSLLA